MARKREKRKRNRLGDVPGIVMLAIVLVYSVVMIVDGYLLCRSGIIKGPECVCQEKPQEVIFVSSGESGVLEEGMKTTYFHDALKLAFEYPSEWGPVTIREEMGTDPTGRQIVIGLMLYFRDMAEQSGGGLFLHASNPNTDPVDRRLDYWGSDGVAISSAFDLRGWCDDKEDCDYFTNVHGVLIAKQKVNPGGVEGGASFNVYYLHNKGGGYNGVALSSERLDIKFGAINMQKGFEELVDGIKLLD
ncbi:MAG: hypothetical protein U9Q03_02460 [Patescibacteria group bacterium]|nr:hypothetical protein [Patescibacteria group bacterium]